MIDKYRGTATNVQTHKGEAGKYQPRLDKFVQLIIAMKNNDEGIRKEKVNIVTDLLNKKILLFDNEVPGIPENLRNQIENATRHIFN